MTLLLPGLGMLLISLAPILIWRSVARVRIQWFGVGVLLWVVAVPLKLVLFWLTSARVIAQLKGDLPYPCFIAAVGLFVGTFSSAFEMGVTWVAARKWPRLGQDAGRAIAIGLGAGAFEGLLLSLPFLAGALAAAAAGKDAEELRRTMQTMAAATPLYGLLPPVERLIAILVHTSTRTLVLLGVTKGQPLMIRGGILLFTATDGVAGAFRAASGRRPQPSWWIELAVLPGALISIPILVWCYRRWRDGAEVAPSSVR
jgi:hypothetical protein